MRITLADGRRVEIRSFFPGRYRMTMRDGRFGQIKRVGREWHAEVRSIDTGAIARHAGIWPSRREAVAELVDIDSGVGDCPATMRDAQ